MSSEKQGVEVNDSLAELTVDDANGAAVTA